MRFLVLGFLLTTLSSVQQHVDAVSASDSIILSALEEAIDTMRENSNPGSSSSVKRVGRGSSKHECSSLDGPFCPIVNSEMYSLGGSPFSSGEESERLRNAS